MSISLYDFLYKAQVLTERDKKNMVEMSLKLCEEAGELAQAVLSSENVAGCGYKRLTSEEVKEEAIDVITCALSVYFRAGGSGSEFLETILQKFDKWSKNQGDL